MGAVGREPEREKELGMGRKQRGKIQKMWKKGKGRKVRKGRGAERGEGKRKRRKEERSWRMKSGGGQREREEGREKEMRGSPEGDE